MAAGFAPGACGRAGFANFQITLTGCLRLDKFIIMDMKTLKIQAAALVISGLMMSCGNSTDANAPEQTEIVTHEEHSDDVESDALKLNNGEKWMVNDEMKPFILDSETILNEYINSRSTDFGTLAVSLKEKNSGLIKSCTMTGESHDELHKWLHPHMELIESLSKAESAESAHEIIVNLQASYTTYHQFFQ
jgi:hypothetical protein